MARKIIVWCVIFAMLSNQLGVVHAATRAAAASSAAAPSVEERVDRLVELTRDVSRALDRKQFEPSELVNALLFDEQALVDFVTRSVYFEQYQGLLRGVRGTLSSRAGNALDQSILLASLLKDAGWDARIARGRLSSTESERLLEGLLVARSDERSIGDVEQIRSALDGFCSDLKLDCSDLDLLFSSPEAAAPSTAASELAVRVDATTDYLRQLVVDPGALERSSVGREALVEEARDYFWVEYRLGPGDDWLVAHPAFGGHTPEAFEPARLATFADEIPGELQHRFQFEVVMTQRIGDQLKDHVIVPRWTRPAANVADVPLLFYIASNNLAGSFADPDRDFEAQGIETDLFMPYFSAGPVNAAFDYAGNPVPLDAAASAFAGVFRSVANNANRAAGALAAMGSDSQGDAAAPSRLASVERVIARFAFIAPDGARRVYERTMYDTRFSTLSARQEQSEDAAEARAEEFYRAITRVMTLRIQTGSRAPADVLDEELSALAARSPLLKRMLHYQETGELPASPSSAPPVEDQPTWSGFAILASIFDALPGLGESQRIYRDQANLVVHHRTLPIDDRVHEAIDIVQNARRAVERVDGQVQSSPRLLMRTGIWETATEGALLTPSLGASINAFELFEGAVRRGAEPRLLRDVSSLDRMALPEISREAIARDLERGLVVVLPPAEAQPIDSTLAWWRIDPLTGETLGMGFNGQGTSATEYTLKQRLIAFAMIGSVSFFGCLLAGGVVNSHLGPGHPQSVTGGDCVAFGLAMGLGAATGPTVVSGLAEGAAFGIATYALGKLTDAWGVLE